MSAGIWGLIAVRNFATVQDKLYRGAQPLEPWEYKWLAAIGVKKIINLRAEGNTDSHAASFGMHEIRIPVKDDDAPTIEQLNTFTDTVYDSLYRAEAPVFFHCSHGHGRTSTFCAAWRIFSGVTAQQAMAEEAHIYGYQFKHEAQIKALETFGFGRGQPLIAYY